MYQSWISVLYIEISIDKECWQDIIASKKFGTLIIVNTLYHLRNSAINSAKLSVNDLKVSFYRYDCFEPLPVHQNKI
jgi:hypothetical protein